MLDLFYNVMFLSTNQFIDVFGIFRAFGKAYKFHVEYPPKCMIIYEGDVNAV